MTVARRREQGNGSRMTEARRRELRMQSDQRMNPLGERERGKGQKKERAREMRKSEREGH